MIYDVKSFLGNDTNRIELVFMTGANIIKLSSYGQKQRHLLPNQRAILDNIKLPGLFI
jgi:hypothetical protein